MAICYFELAGDSQVPGKGSDLVGTDEGKT